MPTANRVVIDPNIMLGKPVIRGTRITIELVLRKLSEGATFRDLLDAYPNLVFQYIRAVALLCRNSAILP